MMIYHRFYTAKKRVLLSSQYDLKRLAGRTRALPGSRVYDTPYLSGAFCSIDAIASSIVDQLLNS